MNQFVFEQKQKTGFFILMGIGVLCMALTYFLDATPEHARFWTNFLQNSAFFLGLGFVATFFLAANILAYSGWYTVIKRIFEAISLVQGVGILLMAVVCGGVWLGYHHLYHWADYYWAAPAKGAAGFDKVLEGKKGFLNPVFYTVATFVFAGAWYWFALQFRKMSIQQDGNTDVQNYPIYTKMKGYAAAFLPIAGFTSAGAIWLWLMSVDAHWYSTMFAWYTTASLMVTMFAITILLMIYLQGKGYMPQVTKEHFHDMGKFLFAISVFWTYLWFSQYMLIWYANIGEETVYFHTRMTQYPILFYGNVVMNFVLPFLILIRNDTKRKNGTMAFSAFLVLFGHWWDFFQMTKFGPLATAKEHAEHAAHSAHSAVKEAAHGAAEHVAAAGHAAAEHGHEVVKAAAATSDYFAYNMDFTAGFYLPGFLEFGTFAGFIGLFLYVVFSQLAKAPLVPTNDPYLNESLHHHV
jgi:hypothetical protein